MTRGHLGVIEPFVCGNCHFPVRSGSIARAISHRAVFVLLLLLESGTRGREGRRKTHGRGATVGRVCRAREDSAVVIQNVLLQEGNWRAE